MDSITRREFIEAALATCACALCPAVVDAQGAAPAAAAGAAPATGAAPAGAPGGAPAGGPGRPGGWQGGGGGGPQVNVATSPVTVGAATKYSKDGVYDDFAKSSGFILVSDKGKTYAVTAVCPHK